MSAPGDAETAARALGLGVSRLGSGQLVVNAYTAELAAKLESAGYVCQQHARFPGRAKPGAFWECVWTAPPPEVIGEGEGEA